MRTSRKKIVFLMLSAMMLSVTPMTQAQLPDARIFKYFHVEISLFSINPEESSLDSYRSCGSGSASGAGTVILTYSISDRCYRASTGGGKTYNTSGQCYQVSTRVRNNEKKFLVDVTVAPEQNEADTEIRSFEYDLTDMKPICLELEREEKGRIYMLTLIPSIEIIDNRPKRAEDAAKQLGLWNLSHSIVIFNDSVYAGQLGCVGGPFAYISYPGYAKVDFALIPFEGAKMIGMLKDGRVQIHGPGGQTLDIYDVKNGSYDAMKLPGGPYEVWARWEDLPESEETVEIPSKEEWVRMVKEHYAKIGSPAPTAEELDDLYEKAKRQKHTALSSGVSGKPF